MPAIYLLDTNIISQLMKDGQAPSANRCRDRLLKEPDCKLLTSVVVQCELMFGLSRYPSQRLQRAYELQLENLSVMPLDDSICSHYANLRTHLELAGIPMGANDTLIAAHALALDATLVSADAAFARVPGLRLENWLD